MSKLHVYKYNDQHFLSTLLSFFLTTNIWLLYLGTVQKLLWWQTWLQKGGGYVFFWFCTVSSQIIFYDKHALFMHHMLSRCIWLFLAMQTLLTDHLYLWYIIFYITFRYQGSFVAFFFNLKGGSKNVYININAGERFFYEEKHKVHPLSLFQSNNEMVP